jgi:serine/threonine protein kinase
MPTSLSLFMSCVYLCPAVDLLDSILLLDPDTRMTAKEGLSHPYLSEFHDPESEPDSPPYDDSFESMELDVGEWSSEYILPMTDYLVVHVDGIYPELPTAFRALHLQFCKVSLLGNSILKYCMVCFMW